MKQAHSVSGLVSLIKKSLETEFSANLVEGEISNLSSSFAGHWYFTLSDSNSSISCALFKMDAARNPLIKNLKDGDQIIISGPISVYNKRGTFQILVKRIVPAGRGSLQLQFEMRKEMLAKEGLFDLQQKREIPKIVSKIAVITALGGAALQDFLNILKRRMLWYEVIIIPAVVQGDKSEQSLISALHKAIQYKDLDVIVLTRGGGAMEDLWSFNGEGIVREVFNCPIPVISAVGHQVDYTLLDYVADLRCETPSAAAEVLSQRHTELNSLLSNKLNILKTQISHYSLKIDNHLKRSNPEYLLSKLKLKLKEVESRFEKLNILKSFETYNSINIKGQHLDEVISSMNSNIGERLVAQRHSLEKASISLKALNPKDVLNRGYSIVRSKNKVVETKSTFELLDTSQTLEIEFSDGIVNVKK